MVLGGFLGGTLGGDGLSTMNKVFLGARVFLLFVLLIVEVQHLDNMASRCSKSTFTYGRHPGGMVVTSSRP
jgi:hypothetical protein